MSDTLRERLDRMAALMHYAGNHRDAATVEETIAELDRLEAEVKKPRLPPGWIVVGNENDILLGRDGHPERYTQHEDGVIFAFLSAFLTTPDVVPSARDLSIPKEWSERKAEEIGSDECAAGLLAADPFNTQAPAETSDQGQRSQTPMNTETAEKPKPVSLVEKFSRERIGGNIDYWAKNTFGSPSHDQEAREIILWILRTLDQERGV